MPWKCSSCGRRKSIADESIVDSNNFPEIMSCFCGISKIDVYRLVCLRSLNLRYTLCSYLILAVILYIPLHIRVFTTALAWFSNSAILQSIEDLFKYYKCIRFYVCLNASWLSQPHLPKVITLFYKTQVDAFDEMQPNLSFCYRPAAQTTR